jgi:outer membrane protein assembly factor BamA
LHFLGGTTQALGTLEYRFFTDWYPLRLVRVGGAAFFDMGRAWSTEQGVADPGWLRDIGVGLRLGNARSSRGTVIHVDLAVPLDRSIPGADPIDSVQVLVSTKTSF